MGESPGLIVVEQLINNDVFARISSEDMIQDMLVRANPVWGSWITSPEGKTCSFDCKPTRNNTRLLMNAILGLATLVTDIYTSVHGPIRSLSSSQGLLTEGEVMRPDCIGEPLIGALLTYLPSCCQT